MCGSLLGDLNPTPKKRQGSIREGSRNGLRVEMLCSDRERQDGPSRFVREDNEERVEKQCALKKMGVAGPRIRFTYTSALMCQGTGKKPWVPSQRTGLFLSLEERIVQKG